MKNEQKRLHVNLDILSGNNVCIFSLLKWKNM